MQECLKFLMFKKKKRTERKRNKKRENSVLVCPLSSVSSQTPETAMLFFALLSSPTLVERQVQPRASFSVELIQTKLTVIAMVINSPSVPATGSPARPPTDPAARRRHLHCTGPESPTIRRGLPAANKTSRGRGRPAGPEDQGAAWLPSRGQSVRGHSPTRAPPEAACSLPSTRGRGAQRAAGRRARGGGRQPDAACDAEPRARRAQLPSSRLAPSLRSPARWLARSSVVAAVADKCDVGRRGLPLSQAASASASPALARSRGRRLHLSAGRPGVRRGAGAPRAAHSAHSAHSARTRPTAARTRTRGRRGRSGGRRRRGRDQVRGAVGVTGRGGGGRHLCRAGVTEVKYMLTMGRPGSQGCAGGPEAWLPASPSLVPAGRGTGSLRMLSLARDVLVAPVPCSNPRRPLSLAIWSAPSCPVCVSSLAAETAQLEIKPLSDLSNPLLLADFQADYLLSH